MKKIITSAALVLLVGFYLPACKKSDKKQTTLDKIQGVWQLETYTYNEHLSGQDNITTITGGLGDFFDFRTNGILIEGIADTTIYRLSGDTKIVINLSTYDITTLTSNSFILHIKDDLGGTDFDEGTISLKK